MTAHAEDPLRRPGISQVLNLPLAVPTPEAGSAERLISGQNRQILNLIATGVAAISAIIAYKGSIAEQEEVGV
jgi:hypothetical protein